MNGANLHRESTLDIPDDVFQAFYEKRAAFFVSAGCSMESGLPSANELALEVVLALHGGRNTSFEAFSEETFGSVNPKLEDVAEFFLDRDGDLLEFAKLIPFHKWNRRPAKVHETLVRLSLEGYCSRVITTNWDTLIETASSNMQCSSVSVRAVAELGVSGDVDLRLFKIHGCRTRPESIVAAQSQLVQGSPGCLWVEPQLKGMFQGTVIVFMGYSGSIGRISSCMGAVAAWAAVAGVQHYAVDVVAWPTFSSAASDFVSAADLREERYSSSGATSFVTELCDRIFRRLFLEIALEDAPAQRREIWALGEMSPVAGTVVPAGFLSEISSADGSEVFLRALTREFDGYPAARHHRQQAARVLAWVSDLAARGWQPVGALPLLEKDGRRVYLATGGTGTAARNVAIHVLQSLTTRASFRKSVVDQAGGLDCVLVLAPGDPPQRPPADFAYNASRNDLAYGSPDQVKFYTEGEFLREVTAA